ncbi:RNA-guided endonuclease InsQ/TnpB family protein [Glycomyces tenuis]|uniref:RNA-guided endonuclease InsQ/TnpB family protein n=1 Tax=Glycomyces tenuis TaxID=58116 RepID=UPI000405AAAB|nr:RNA-guided endonuclease TnpB family protein [Glycomyces tenuis]
MTALRYQYRIYPTAPQRQMLARTFGCVRTVYNDALKIFQDAWRAGSVRPSMGAVAKAVTTDAKRTAERAWLGEVSAVPLQQALRDLATAYTNFFASVSGRRPGPRVGPPRFKKRTERQSARFNRNAFALKASGRLYVAKVGDLRVAWSRALPSVPSSVTVIKTATGKYYASFVVAVDDGAELAEPITDPEAETGIDLGLKAFAVLRGGKVIENPRFFRRLERKLRKAQRALSRKQQGSSNRAKARVRVAKIHEKVRHTRADWVDKQIHRIVRENQAVYVEDLCVTGLSRGRVAKSVHDAALGMFLGRLESKAHRAGRTFVRVDRLFPSTRLCSACGALTGPKGLEGLSVRQRVCGCGAVHDRDRNAEINIRREGRRLVAEGLPDT